MINLIQPITVQPAFTPGGEHHGIVDEEGLTMRRTMNPPLRSPERLQISPPDENMRWRWLCTVKHNGSFSLIFFFVRQYLWSWS